MSTPWQTDEWFVSPWDYADEVRENLHFAPQIKVHDVTLRDGAQQTGVVFTQDEKLRIAEALAEAGVHRIEAGMPAVSRQDEAAIREIVKRNLGPQIFGFARCMIDDVKRSLDCGVSGVVMEIPSSTHIIEYAYRWPLEKAIDQSVQATAYAHAQGLEVVFFPIDFTRADIHWVLDLITRVAQEGHMDALGLVDTFGVMSPHAMQYLVRSVRSRIDKRLEAHFHMDFGLGVANTLMALAEGVEVMHTTVLGVGERAGNTPMEETVLALKMMYGVDLGIKTEKLYGLAKLVQAFSGQPVPGNRAVSGDALFQVESGIISSWVKNAGDQHLTELFPYRPEVVGQRPAQVVVGRGNGLDSIKMHLSRHGLKATDQQTQEILQAVKEYGIHHKRLLTESEFDRIARAAIAQDTLGQQ
jgi:isopropylmalate/homocitrate/citramalate synthase